jgi:hypothetical protein
MSEVLEVTMLLFKRYLKILEDIDIQEGCETSKDHLEWMCRTALQHQDYPIDKLSRWLGFVQGVLTARGKLSVDDERDYSKPLFHNAYEMDGHQIPPTIHRKDK